MESSLSYPWNLRKMTLTDKEKIKAIDKVMYIQEEKIKEGVHLLDLLKSRLETGQDSNGEILLVIEEIKRVLTY